MRKTLKERAQTHLLLRRKGQEEKVAEIIDHIEKACGKAIELARRDFDPKGERAHLSPDIAFNSRQFVRSLVAQYFSFLDGQGTREKLSSIPDTERPDNRYQPRPYLDPPELPAWVPEDDMYLLTELVQGPEGEKPPTTETPGAGYKSDRERAHSRIKELHTQGISKNRMVNILDSEGIRGPHGGKWHVTSIGRVLSSP